MFLLDGDDRVVYATGSLATLLGVDADSLTGTPFQSYVSEGEDIVQRVLHSVRRAERPASRVFFCELSSEGQPLRVQVEFVSPASPADDVVGTVRGGVDDRTRNELAAEQERFGLLFDLIDDAVIEVEIVDGDPIVRSVNDAFESVFGYSADTVRGESLNDYIVPTELDGEADEFDRRTADGRANRAVVTRRTASGRREFLYRGIPYDREDGGQYGFAIYSDVTDQRHARERLQVLQRVLRHNLRNQLTVVRGMASLVDETTDDDDVAAAAGRIVDSADTLAAVSAKSQTAADVLDAGTETTAVDIVEQAETVTERASSAHPEATVTTEFPRSLAVEAGPGLERALSNLVENALEHGGDCPNVHVTVERRDDTALLAVTDDGPGIPDTERLPIFGDGRSTKLDHASGLGLWLVKWIVESAGGRLAYDRTDGLTTVEAWLPLSTPSARSSTGKKLETD
jgi:PAS domain S-box-containing protein